MALKLFFLCIPRNFTNEFGNFNRVSKTWDQQ